MAVEVVMPRLGWTMETGTFAEWLKHDGETVQAGDILFTVETDKVAQEVEAMDGGILRIPPDAAASGTELPVGAVLAYLVQPGEPAPFEQRQAAPSPAPTAGAPAVAAVPEHPTAAAPTPRANGHAMPAASPRARRVAHELGVDWMTLQGSGRTGRIVERDVRAAAQAAPARARVSPVARRVAQQSGVDVEELATQLPGKRITRSDVETAVPARAPAALDERAGQPLSRMRRTIAERMAQSAHTVAPVTLTTEADATELAALRERIKQSVAGSTKPVPSYTDLLARLVALALLEHPWLNSSLA
ncbi:MAG TPA: E3 binding domain-containing protein, partial [Chloroflexota bacterium]|nr:E3 binding domain-containing protein [Chloroflexota bacterium]